MQEIKVLKETEILEKKFSVYGSVENPLFLAKDVAEWIEHSQPSVMLRNIDEDEKVMNSIHTLGGIQEMWFLTEDGVYEVLMQSRKPIAKQFKKQVKRILKEIRLYGRYDVPSNFSEALELALQQQKAIEQKNAIITTQNQVIGELKPKADYVDKILKSKTLLNISQIAKDYGLSAQALNRILHELRIQYKLSKQWLLYSKYQTCGYTKSETYIVDDTPGFERTELHTKWTQKGRLFLYELLKDNGYVPLMEQEEKNNG